jgi:Domain of unknown function (DUF5753)
LEDFDTIGLRGLRRATPPGWLVTAIHQDRPDISDTIAQRMQRQAVLYDEARRFEFVIGEAALRWRYGSAAVQLGQLDRIRSIATLPTVLIGIVPLSRETPAWDSHGFTIFEDRVDDGDPFVHVETLTAGLNITEPTDVQAYRQMFDRLRELALDREDAKGLLAELMDELSQ